MITNNASQSGIPMDESGFGSSHDCTVPRVKFGGGGIMARYCLGSAHRGLAISTTLAFKNLHLHSNNTLLYLTGFKCDVIIFPINVKM